MGNAKKRLSPAVEAKYSDAKDEIETALENDRMTKSVDLATKAALASQPNGPAKVPTYKLMKFGGMFMVEAHKNGVEEGVREVAPAATRAALIKVAYEAVVRGAQDTVLAGAEHELVTEHVDTGNKNVGDIAEQAAKDTIGDIMAQGPDALREAPDSTDD